MIGLENLECLNITSSNMKPRMSLCQNIYTYNLVNRTYSLQKMIISHLYSEISVP